MYFAGRMCMNFFKMVSRLFGIAFLGFMGGFLSFPLLDFYSGTRHFANDAIAIANTYIVFTTVIFAGLAVVIAIIGYVFTQQFAVAKDVQMTHLVNEVKASIRDNDKSTATDIAQIILDNKEVKRYIMRSINNAIMLTIRERYEDIRSEDIANLRDMLGKDKGDTDK